MKVIVMIYIGYKLPNNFQNIRLIAVLYTIIATF